MSGELEIDGYYKRQAEVFVDMLFNKEFLNPEIDRDSHRKLEEYIAYIMQSQVDSAVKASQLMVSLKKS